MEVTDILAIRSLADRYSDAANRMNTKDMAAVYTEDAELVAFGNSFKGRSAIEKVFESTFSEIEFMNQICSGAVIEVNGDRATSRWTVTEFNKRESRDRMELFLGNYEDELVRQNGQWLFARRILTRRVQVRIDGTIRIES